MSTTLTKKAQKQAAIDEARAVLLNLLKPGSDVYAIVKRVSSTGMSRRIAILTVKNGKIENITGWVASLLELKWNDDGSLTVGGAGMDMGFHVVYSMSRALWPDGFECAGTGGRGDNSEAGRCRSNDHSNGDDDYKPHHHGDGGYALVHQRL